MFQSLHDLCGHFFLLSTGCPCLSHTLECRYGHRSPGTTSPGLRERVTSLHLLAALLRMQPRIQLAFFVSRAHHWLMYNLYLTGQPRLFLTSCFPAGWSNHVLVCEVVPPRVQDFALPLQLHKVPVSLFLQVAKVPLADSLVPWHIKFCVTGELVEGLLCPLTLMNRTEPSTDPQSTVLVASF